MEDFVKDVHAKYKADRAVLKEAYKAMPKTPATPTGPPPLPHPMHPHTPCPSRVAARARPRPSQDA